ncbi:MAG: ribonuclease III family protein [bacterium]
MINKLIEKLDEIQQKIDYFFNNKYLLIQAFLHDSVFVNPVELEIDNKKIILNNNQRLEFLGDSLLNYIVSEYAYMKYPSFSEDSLSSYKTLIVNYFTLYKVCDYLKLQEYLIFNYESLGKNSPNIKTYADIIEAIIAVIYLDSGNIEEPKKFFRKTILKVFEEKMEEIVENVFDWKGFLQSFLQKKGMDKPKYLTIEKNSEGFLVVAYYNNVEISSGFGKTKKEAEKQAALSFLRKIF